MRVLQQWKVGFSAEARQTFAQRMYHKHPISTWNDALLSEFDRRAAGAPMTKV